ncbi:MAG TPA: class I adenylate-forming enzyme family protein, partial [Micrococcaceae bacterium]|nr:class I adenylate-forming enzyme family protein [Micrococcaceae bacterium]
LHFLGRRSDMMVSAGHNVYPHEIELALQDLPGVQTAIVTGMADGYRGHRIVAAVLPQKPGPQSSAPGAEAFRTSARQLLPAHKRPTAYFALRELPVTAGGKISRPLLADWIAGRDPRVSRLS